MASQPLWFDRPATTWTEALPLGNGRTGAMVFGRPFDERIQINDGAAWSGSPDSEFVAPQISAETARSSLAEARAAIHCGDNAAADQALRRMQHRHSQSYLPFVDLRVGLTNTGAEPFEKSDVAGYRRALDLSTAVHTTAYLLNGARVRVRSFVSAPAGVLVHSIESLRPIGETTVRLSSLLRVLQTRSISEGNSMQLLLPTDVVPVHDESHDPVRYDDGQRSLQGAAVFRIVHDGEVAGDDAIPDVFRVRGASTVSIVLATETTFAGVAREPVGDANHALERASERVDAAVNRDPEELLAEHVADHSRLYNRAHIDLGDAPDLPLDERILRGNRHPDGPLAADPALAADLFHYGRYLLIASSRPGGAPANLQGIWNENLQAVWSSNYTTNINLQMNYWMAESANLTECLPPLFDLIEGLSRTGRRVARDLYAAPGWATHHNTDIWAYPLPVGGGDHDPKWAFWPLAGPWLIRHYWEHVLHGANDEFIRDRAWEPTRSAAEFALAWLREQDDGTLGTVPSTSPENQFLAADGQSASAGRSSSYDLVAIGDLLDIVVAMAERLGLDDAVTDAARAARVRIPGPSIGANGLVKEWIDDVEYPDPTHRHMMHLYFLHPSDRPVTPELATAASRSMDDRGDESTGWSLTWRAAMRARLAEPDRVGELFRLLFRDMTVDRGPWVGGIYPNLFTAHPPFQIDANFGFVAALLECLVQSHRGAIELLRAVPHELAAGSVQGIRARPGVEVDLTWVAGDQGRAKLVSVSLRALVDGTRGPHLVRHDGAEVVVELGDDTVTVKGDAFARPPAEASRFESV